MDDAADTVVPIDLGFRPEQAISAPVLLRTDEVCFLTFNAVVRAADGLDDRAGHGVVEFERCAATRFGSSHDGPGFHPLSAALPAPDDTWSGVFEVLRSTWARENREYWQSVSSHTVEPLRHFLLVFHESVVECLAAGLRAELLDIPYAAVLERITARV